MANIYQNPEFGTLNARLVLYNRRHPHDKVYIITMWVDSSRQYRVVPYYGRRLTWEQNQPDFRALTKGPVSRCWNATEAYEEFENLAAKKVEQKGYTTNSDGVSYINRFQLPHASNLVTQMGDERNAAQTTVTGRSGTGGNTQTIPRNIIDRERDMRGIAGVVEIEHDLPRGEFVIKNGYGDEHRIGAWVVQTSNWVDLRRQIVRWLEQKNREHVQPVAKPVVAKHKGRFIEW